jgi:sulfur dioxygenase
MLVRQLFNHATFSYTYLLADPMSSDAVLIDPVKGKLREYVQLFNELGLSAVAAIDTHHHDDHISALGVLHDLWGCDTIVGAPNDMPGLTRQVKDGDTIQIGGLQLQVIHTPGHSDDSYCFHIDQPGKSGIFTGDTLLVRTLGLSNQGTSNMRMHYDSLFNVLAKLPDSTLIYPGRDFKGWPLSTIGEEKEFNPYLQATDVNQFIDLKMNQKPADIVPLMKLKERDDEELLAAARRKEAVVETDTPVLEEINGAAPPAATLDMEFHLPDPEKAADGAAPQQQTESAAAVKNKQSTQDAGKLAPADDPRNMPSWR